MKSLIVWLNRIINKHKALKRWKRVVTVLAAIMTFATTYALILPAITVERSKTEEVGGMYLEQDESREDVFLENAQEPRGVSIAADHENAATFAYADDSMTATAVFGTDEEIPAGAELVVTPVDPESEEYISLSSRSAELLDKEFIYDVTTCSFYDFALVCDNVDVTPKTGLVDIQIIFHNNTVEHIDDTLFAGRFANAVADENGFVEIATGSRTATDKEAAVDALISVNPDETSVIELTDGIITALSLKGNDLALSDSLVGILAGNVDEETKAAAAETDAEIPYYGSSREEDTPEYPAEAGGDEAAPEVRTLKATGSDYTVILTYDATSEIPEGASLTVSEIAQNSKEYKKYLEETKKAMGLTEEETLPQYAARFFDIKIMVGGDEFVPESGVTVEIAYTEPLAANPETEVNAVHFHNDTTEPEVIEANVTEISSDGTSNVEFTAEAFSVYGVVYTVDFHYEINGKMYEFSIPGGGFVSLEHVVEVLGIASAGENAENVERSAENEDEFAGEESGTDVSNESGTAYEEAIKLNEVEVSNATKKFVADVESVEFSSPDLVWVGKVNEEASVGGLKEANMLEVEYSAKLTEEQITDINSSTVEAGDWALISLQPFMSEETLNVTMKDGEIFTIRVTDAQIKKTVISASGETYEITVTYDQNAEIPEGASLNVTEILPGTQGYMNYLVASLDALEENETEGISFARFFDIEIVKDGIKIEPKTPVQVEVSYVDKLELESDSALKVVHFAEDGVEVISDIDLDNSATTVTYEQESFSVTGTIINQGPHNGSDYVVILKKNNKYYVVLNDGTLEEVTMNGNNFTMDHPMLWTYEGDHVTHKAFARTLNNLKTASTWYYKYLDPGLPEGISVPTVGQILFDDEDPDVQLQEIDTENNEKRSHASLQYTGGKLKSTSTSNTNYYLSADETSMHVIGQTSSNDAAEVFFASVDINYNMSNYDWNRFANSCNHIDISVEAIAGVDVPLAYGDYYDKAGNLILSVSRENPVILKLSKKVDVTEDDIKNADLKAFTKDADGRQTEVNNAFYVTGYSGNAPVEGSTAQVRVEGVFKVADWTDQNARDSYENGDVPRNHRIYYSLSTVKNETFELSYNGIPLYISNDTSDPNRKPLSINTDVTLSTSFDYWDEDNECPGIMQDWQPGGTPTQRWQNGWINATNLDGMDFVLGTQSEGEPGVVAVEITKFIVDTEGNLISTKTVTKNVMEIYLDKDGNPDAVKDLDVNKYTQPANYNGYAHVHDRTITVGEQGLGSIYDYAVDPGMIYIREKPESIQQELVDSNDDKWVYHSTRIETEYVWRNNDGRMHISDTYRANEQNQSYASIPEVLGGYEFEGCTSPNYAVNGGKQPYNGFLEFYVYNVYAPEDTDLTVSKLWKKGDTEIAALEGAEVKVFLKRYKLVPDDLYYDKGRLYISKTFSGAEQDGFAAIYTVAGNGHTWQLSYNDLPKTLSDLEPGTYTITEEVSSDGAPFGYEAYHSEPVTVDVIGGQTATANFLTRYAHSSSGRPATVQIYNDQYSHDVKYNNSFSYYAGDTLQVSWTRSYNATIRYRINNGSWIPLTVYPDNSGPEQRRDSFTVTIPEDGILNIELDDSWNSIHNLEVTKVGGLNRSLMRRNSLKAPMRADSGTETVSFTNSNEAPVSNTPGMKYVVDETWPDAASEMEYERDLAENGIILTNGHWTDESLKELPAYDANGRYIYAIHHIEEINLPEGTQVVFGKEGGSDLTVENHLPKDLSVTKAWNDGENAISWPEDGPEFIEIQLTRSTDGVIFQPATNIHGIVLEPVIITADNPVATFEGLPYMDGNGKKYQYKASEVTVPDEYRPVVTTDADGNVTITNTRMAVTVKKVDENNMPLPGAGFTLYKNTVDENGRIEEIAADNTTTQFCFKNLSDGNYFLQETETPTGYAALVGDIRFTVSDKSITVNEKPDNVSWNGDSFVFTVKNTPLEDNITVRKQWLDFFGNATEYDGTIDLELVQWVTGEPVQHSVSFIIQCEGDGAVDGHGDVLDEGQVYQLATRSGSGVGDVSIHWDWDQYTEDKPFVVSGLEGSSYDTEQTSGGQNNRGGRTVTIHNITKDLTVTILIKNGGWKGTEDPLIGQPSFNGNNPHAGPVVPTGGTKSVTLDKDNAWTRTFSVSGEGKLSDSSQVLPATYNGKNCFYTIAEETIPGYTIDRISTDPTNVGVLTAYNKKNTVDLNVVKMDESDTTTLLNGATFVLRQIDPTKTGSIDLRTLTGTELVTKTTAGEGAEKGRVVFDDLKPGVYELKETIAPAGYVLLNDSTAYFRVGETGIHLLQADVETAAESWRTIAQTTEATIQNGNMTISNTPGAVLPSTGGPGTRLFTILGSILILGAGVLLWRRRRLI